MAQPRLRVYFGPDDDPGSLVEVPSPRAASQITVPLAQVLPALVDAVQTQRAWLKDFEDERIAISADLYEVLLAYQELRSTG